MYVAVCASLALSACAQRHWKLLRHLVKPGTHCDIDFVWHSDFASASASSSRMTNACTPVCCRICVHHTIVTCTPDRCIPIKWWMRHPHANFVSLSPSLDLGRATNFPLVKWWKLLRSRIAELKLENFHSIFIRGSACTHSASIHLHVACVIELRQDQTNINSVFRFNSVCHQRRYLSIVLLSSFSQWEWHWKTIERCYSATVKPQDTKIPRYRQRHRFCVVDGFALIYSESISTKWKGPFDQSWQMNQRASSWTKRNIYLFSICLLKLRLFGKSNGIILVRPRRNSLAHFPPEVDWKFQSICGSAPSNIAALSMELIHCTCAETVD